MAKRGQKTELDDQDKADIAVKAKRSTVFDTHGNDFIGEHIEQARLKKGDQEQSSMLDMAAEDVELAQAKGPAGASQSSAVGELKTMIDMMAASPEAMAKVISGKESTHDRTIAILAALGNQLSDPAVKTLATMSVAEVSNDLGGMVVSSAGLAAAESSKETENLGGLGAVLYDMVTATLAKAAAPKLSEVGQVEEKDETIDIELALKDASATLQFM